MAEEFQAGICGGNWWNPSKSIFMGCSSPYSTGISDMASFGWAADMVDIKPKSNCEESNNFQNDHQQKPDQQQQQQADSDSGGSSILIDSTLQMMGFGLSSLSTSEWNQSLLRSNGGTNQTYNTFLQEDINSRLGNCRQETVMDSSQIPKEWSPKSYTTSPGEDSSITTFKPINQDFSLNSITSTPTCQGLIGYPSPTLIQTLFESDPQPQPSLFNNRPINYMSGEATYGGANSNEPSSPPWPKLAPFVRPPKQQQQQQQPGSLHFTNNTAFWNASASSGGINNVKAGLLPSVPQSQYLAQTFEDKPNCPSLTKTKANSEELRDSGSVVKKGSSDQPPFKRPRIETPSPLPTFKVRKEKLGDRITALQQLVSPFGKTDTASVLHEAIEYIKLLHDQVNVLSTPYMKQAATPIQQQSCDKLKEATEGPKQDLRSRGLCLVPISSTFPVANETMADFWTPTFGGTFR